MRSNTSRPPFSQYLCTELILSKSDSFYVKAVDLDDYRTACAVNKSFLTLYFFKKVYRILGSPVIIKNNLFHHFNMNILNRFVFGIVIVNISLCELPEIFCFLYYFYIFLPEYPLVSKHYFYFLNVDNPFQIL